MAFILKNGAVFLHIPKTGGTSVKHVLEHLDLIKAPLGHMHSDWERSFWHDKLHHDLKVARYIFRRTVRSPRAQARIDPNCFRFCFIRKPLSWYESYWRFMQSQDWNWANWGDEKDPYRWHPCAMVNRLGSPDFNTFISNVNRKRPGFVTELFGWYVRPGISFVGKMENLQQDLARVFSLMKFDVDPLILSKARQNETPSSIPKPEWDPALKRETFRLEYAGYVRYGYAVEGEYPNSPEKAFQSEMSR
jgi:hypothetical protein